MSTVDVVGLMALVITLVYTCFGLPAQIRRNYVNKSTEGLSVFMIVLLLCTFSIWGIYAMLMTPVNWYIFGANIPGAICAASLLVQFRLYRKK